MPGTALLLVATNAAFFAWRWRHADRVGTITWVGIDSLGIEVPASQAAARLREGQGNGSGDRGPDSPIAVRARSGRERPLAFITLEPRPTYGHFIEAIRDLKARKNCNVAIREGGKSLRSAIPLPDDSFEMLEVPAFVLCGTQLGDAGFSGTLPPDGPIRLSRDSMVEAVSRPAR